MLKSLVGLSAGLSAALVLAGCASDRVDFGGVMSPAEPGANAIACRDSEFTPDVRHPPVYPGEVLAFLFYSQTYEDRRLLPFRFDIDAQGRTANIRFTGPENYHSHGALRQLVLASAEAIDEWTYAWPAQSEPIFTTGCQTSFDMHAQFGGREAMGAPGDD